MKHVLYIEVIKTFNDYDPMHRKVLGFRLLLNAASQTSQPDQICTLDVLSDVFCDQLRLVRYINATYPGYKLRISGIRVSKDVNADWWFGVIQHAHIRALGGKELLKLRRSWYTKILLLNRRVSK